MRAAVLIAAGCATAALAACGNDPAPSKPPPRVRVQISRPADRSTVRSATVDVRGTVSPPAADVRVLGRPARVLGGDFSVVVPLDPGVNVIDVAATARDSTPSLTAFRVTREQRVSVPDLAGMALGEAQAALATLGLRLRPEAGGSLLDPLIPRPPRVCEQQPPAGTKVRRGTTVSAVLARLC